MKTNDDTTCLNCDQCGLLAENQTFFEVVSDEGEQFGVWYGTPTNWLTFVDEHGYVVYACTKDCAVLLSKKVMSPYWKVREDKVPPGKPENVITQD